MTPLPPNLIQSRQRLIKRYQESARGLLHLGAHIGQERQTYDQLGKPVLWVEAHPEIFQTLQRNLESFPKQRAICALLADVDGRQHDFYRSNNAEGVSSSLFEFGPYAAGEHTLWPELDLKMVTQFSLPTLRLDTLLAANHFAAADYNFWIVDLQGAEALALAGAVQSLVACEALLVEISTVEVYRGGATWESIQQILQTHGFIPVWEPAQPHDDILFVKRPDAQQPRAAFQSDHYLRHNQRRLEHLASIGLDLQQKTVLEVGAGIGDHTAFYLDRGCHVLATEGRLENLLILQDRYHTAANLETRHLDLDNPEPLNQRYDLVHCYGLLYHLEDPAAALAYLASHCGSLLLLESCVSFGEDDALHPVEENVANSTQSISGVGCRPTRGWIWQQLQTYFPHVYAPRTQPSHEEFPLDWRDATIFPAKTLTRAIFIATRHPLASPHLLPFLPPVYER